MIDSVVNRPEIKKGDLVSLTLRDGSRISWNNDGVSVVVSDGDSPSEEIRLIVDSYKDKGANSYIIGHQSRGRYGIKPIRIHLGVDCLKYEVLRYLGEKRSLH